MAINWLDKDQKKIKSKKQEKALSKKLSARTQAGSGSLYGSKGDVRAEAHLIELKRTDKDSIVLHASWLEKIRKEAIKDDRTPVLGIEIHGKTYFIMEDCYF